MKNGKENNADKTNEKVIVYAKPDWVDPVHENVKNSKTFARIFMFYVINTPCEKLSASAIPITSYGWSSDVWQKGKLKAAMKSIAGLDKKNTFCSAATTDSVKDALVQASMTGDFEKKLDRECMAFFIPKHYNEMTAMFYHIRNSLAHGRFCVSKGTSKRERKYILEDVVPNSGSASVRARMVLRESTLLQWIDIIEAGPDALSPDEKDQ